MIDHFYEENWIDERCELNKTFKANRNRNSSLKEIPFGEWVCYVDSDNIVHPDFFVEINKLINENPYIDMFVFGQDRCEGNFLKAAPENMIPCKVDGAQIVYRNNGRLWEECLTADGILLQQLYKDYKNTTMFVDKILCFHNFSVQGKVQ